MALTRQETMKSLNPLQLSLKEGEGGREKNETSKFENLWVKWKLGQFEIRENFASGDLIRQVRRNKIRRFLKLIVWAPCVNSHRGISSQNKLWCKFTLYVCSKKSLFHPVYLVD